MYLTKKDLRTIAQGRAARKAERVYFIGFGIIAGMLIIAAMTNVMPLMFIAALSCLGWFTWYGLSLERETKREINLIKADGLQIDEAVIDSL